MQDEQREQIDKIFNSKIQPHTSFALMQIAYVSLIIQALHIFMCINESHRHFLVFKCKFVYMGLLGKPILQIFPLYWKKSRLFTHTCFEHFKAKTSIMTQSIENRFWPFEIILRSDIPLTWHTRCSHLYEIGTQVILSHIDTVVLTPPHLKRGHCGRSHYQRAFLLRQQQMVKMAAILKFLATLFGNPLEKVMYLIFILWCLF